MDLCGPFSYEEHKEIRYFLTVVDDFSRMVFAIPVGKKSDVPGLVIGSIKKWERMFVAKGYLVSKIRTDNG